MAHSFGMSGKIRHGLFSAPVSTAIGETYKYPVKKANRDADGLVITGPRNFYTNKMKDGRDNSVYFTKPNYICLGDNYKLPNFNTTRSLVKDGFMKGGHDKDFCPAKDPHIRVKAKYEYMPMDFHKKKNYRDEEGAVKIGPPNIKTVPIKPGRVGKSTSFSG